MVEIKEIEEAHHTPSGSVSKKRKRVDRTEIEEAHHTPDRVIHEDLHNWGAKDRNGSTSVQASTSSHWDPKNLGLPDTIFLSHSGVDKPFARTVYDKLLKRNYVSFLDDVSLPKASTVTMKNILQVARECKLAIFFLSDAFFLNTKNPMLELAAAIDSKRRLLPLFYCLTVEEFKNEERRQKWFEKWKQWEEEESGRGCALEDDLRVNMSKWQSALKIIGHTNGVERKRGSQSEQAYRKAVIECIMKVVPPDLRWDDSKIQGKERLCESVEGLFSSEFSDEAAPRILGLFAMGGMGKTTLCTAMLNFYNSEFNMKVCCIELESGRSSQSKEEELNRIKKVLKALTNAHPPLVERATDVQQGWHLLKQRIQDNKVFLVVDNVSLETEKECSGYLDLVFQSGSKIVITGRSKELLESVLRKRHHGSHSHVTDMPSPTKEEATRIFVQELGHDDRRQLTQEESTIVRDCVELCRVGGSKLCRFGESKSYHCLALVVLAALLGDTSPQDWKRTVEDWKSKSTKALIDTKAVIDRESVFGVLVTSYDALKEKEQKIFMDISLFAPRPCLRNSEKLLEWLDVVHEDDDVNASLKVLRRRALLNGSNKVHDLHREMALRVANEAANSSSLFSEVHRKKLNQALFEEMVDRKSRSAIIERIGFANCEFEKSLDLSACPRLRVLKLTGNKGLREVVIGQNRFLRSLEVESGEAEDSRVAVRGLKNCSLLGWLSLDKCVPKDPAWWGLGWRDDAVRFLPALRFLNLKGGRISHLQGCKELERFTLTDSALQKPICLSNLTKLREVRLVSCGGLKVLRLGSLPGTLEGLYVRDCKDLVAVEGLESLSKLEFLGCRRLRKICGGAMKYGSSAAPTIRSLFVDGSSNLVEIHGLDLPYYLGAFSSIIANISDWTHLHSLAMDCGDHRSLPDFSKMTELRWVQLLYLDSASVVHSLAGLPNLEWCCLYYCSIPCDELVKLLTPGLSEAVAMGILEALEDYARSKKRKICDDLLMGSHHVVPLFISLLATIEHQGLRCPGYDWLGPKCPRYAVILFLCTLQDSRFEASILKRLMFRQFLGTVGMIDALLHFGPEHPTTLWFGLALIQYANKEHQVPIKVHIANITNALAFVFSNPINLEDRYNRPYYMSLDDITIDVARRTCMLARDEDVMANMKETNIYHKVEPKLVQLEEKCL